MSHTWMCSSSCAWCCLNRIWCCFWNSEMRSCFWICCCLWISSSSRCNCFSQSSESRSQSNILTPDLPTTGSTSAPDTRRERWHHCYWWYICISQWVHMCSCVFDGVQCMKTSHSHPALGLLINPRAHSAARVFYGGYFNCFERKHRGMSRGRRLRRKSYLNCI